MPYDTVSLGLTLKWPRKGTVSWSSTMLDDFAKAISAHDHTGSGKGLQIGTNAISNAAVTPAKISIPRITSSITVSKFSGSGTYTPTSGTIVYGAIGKQAFGTVNIRGTIAGEVKELQVPLPVNVASLGLPQSQFVPLWNLEVLNRHGAGIGWFRPIDNDSYAILGQQFNDLADFYVGAINYTFNVHWITA